MEQIQKPMLAATLQDIGNVSYPVLCTPKLDGIRCLIVNGKPLTRKFKPIPNNYIRNKIIESHLPDGFDGELMIEGKSFNELSSDIMSEDGEPNFVYCVFDYYSEDPYEMRMETLSMIRVPEFVIKLLPSNIYNEEDLLDYEKRCLADGHEGVMLRSISSPYKFGRSTEKEGYLLKLKRFTDSEATIIDFEEQMENTNEATIDAFGNTKRSHEQAGKIPKDTLGSLKVKDIYTGVEFSIGTGFDDCLRLTIWNNKDKYIGKVIKYKSQKVGEKDLPRFPVFTGFRYEDDM